MNTCKYSVGALNPHETCTHPNYCVFDSKRIMIEKELVYLENKLEQALRDYAFILEEGTVNSEDYQEVTRRLKIIREDHDKLIKYEQRYIEENMKKHIEK
jgi:hypothetical protein